MICPRGRDFWWSKGTADACGGEVRHDNNLAAVFRSGPASDSQNERGTN
jgi:hypothetical protein